MCIMDNTCYEESVCGACKSAINIGNPQRSPLGHPQHSLLYYNTSADDDVMCNDSHITPGMTGSMKNKENITHNIPNILANWVKSTAIKKLFV